MRRQAAPGPRALAYRYAAATTLAAAVFAVDAFTHLGSAVAVLYVLVLIIVADIASRHAIQAFAVGCVGLTLFAFVYGHGVDVMVEPGLRLLFSLSAILATTVIVLQRHADRLTVESQAELLDVTSDAIYLSDAIGRIAYWNKGAETLYGWSFDEAWGANAHALLATRFPEPRDAIAATLRQTGEWQGELTQRTRAGQTLYLFSRWRRRPDGTEGGGTTLETNTDITARRQADEALKDSERRYRTIFETLAVAIWEHDLRPVKEALDALRAEGVTDLAMYLAQNPDFVTRTRSLIRVTDVNGTALKLMGVATKEDFFTRLDDFLPEDDPTFPAFLLALNRNVESHTAETTIRTRQGELLRVIVAFNFPPGAPLDRVQASVLNITERVKAQEALQHTRSQLDHALRAAMLGEVSASIAHEINQPLAAITAHAAAGQRWLNRPEPDLDEVRASLAQAGAAATRASEVVRRVRTLMTQVEPEKTLLPVNAVVEEALHLLRNEMAAQGIVLAAALGAEDSRIEVDRILLQQVLINLMANAMQAMQATPPGARRLGVRTHAVPDEVIIEVCDTGPGFSEQVAQKAFEPFFTTKAQGMGLGLAMCRTIVTAHGGEIAIAAPEQGMGGKLRLSLPAVPAAES
ncbi:PAS domain S-box protein [Ancylobacter sp. A5.8]|uniref:PAS domain-containing sensor histidine kinase n=1 Tax=Ancylobacter gelatini TaxID=2919920 RepID=UPI001F4E004D|nr:PAS domain-containing sensor histidine kinase [Ancylobacter gelatini]MCJ8142843.1 PAS domain S-box protein [Ancylobacter gelatini]